MREQEIIKKIFSIEWEFLGLWKQPIFSNSFWALSSLSACWQELDFYEKIKGNDLIFAGHHFSNRSDYLVFKKQTIEFLNEKNDFLNFVFKICDREAKKMLGLYGQNSLEKFLKQKIELTAISEVVFLIGKILEEILEKECRKYNITLADFSSLIRPFRKTLLMKYYDELSKTKDLKRFVKNNKWIGYSSLDSNGLTVKIARADLKDLRQRKKAKVNTKCPKELLSFLLIANKLSFYRTYCKESCVKAEYDFLPKIKKIAKKHNLSLKDIENIPVLELIDIIRNGNIPDLDKRGEESGIGLIDKKWIILPPDKTKIILEKINPSDQKDDSKIIKGHSASRGKVRGIAKVVLSFKDISKVKNKDILIATETIPEFLSAMKRASAFVTDQGGITCHAAIVSREFGVPCVVGTKIATKMIKDGDLVEVDADKGIVRIIK